MRPVFISRTPTQKSATPSTNIVISSQLHSHFPLPVQQINNCSEMFLMHVTGALSASIINKPECLLKILYLQTSKTWNVEFMPQIHKEWAPPAPAPCLQSSQSVRAAAPRAVVCTPPSLPSPSPASSSVHWPWLSWGNPPDTESASHALSSHWSVSEWSCFCSFSRGAKSEENTHELRLVVFTQNAS